MPLVAALCAVLVAPALSTASAAESTAPTVNTVSANITFSTTSNTTQTATITVPPGLVPTSISGTLGIPTSLNGQEVRPGTVAMYAGAHQLFEKAAAPGRFTAPLRGTEVVKGQLVMSLQYLVPDSRDDICLAQDQIIGVTDMVIEYSGTQRTPRTVAQFLAPGVTAVSVVVPSSVTSPTDPLAQAGLAAVGALTYRFGAGVPVQLSFGAPDAALVSLPGARIVAFADGPNPVTTSITTTPTGVPQLNITGGGPELTAAATALGSDQLPLATAADTSGLSLTGSPAALLTQPLANFGAPKPTITGWGSHAVFIGVKQSAFRGPISGVHVHLVGTNTAMPAGTAATMNLYWNDFLIGSQVLTEHQSFDITAQVPDSVVTADNGLRIEMTAIPAGGNCRTNMRLIPVGVYIDGTASTIGAARGQSVGPGFPRFPQALGGNLPVAFGTGATTQQSAVDAARIIASLQQANATQLAVSLTSLSDLADTSASGLVTGASTEDSNTFDAPLRLTEFRTIDSQVTFGVGVKQGYAALQAFTQNGRNLLMLGTWSPSADLDHLAQTAAQQLADYTVTTKGGWASLKLDLLVDQVGIEPVELSTNAVTPQAQAVEEYRPYALWALIAFLVLFALGLVRLIWSRRTKRQLQAYVDAQQLADAAFIGSAVVDVPSPTDHDLPKGDDPDSGDGALADPPDETQPEATSAAAAGAIAADIEDEQGARGKKSRKSRGKKSKKDHAFEEHEDDTAVESIEEVGREEAWQDEDPRS
jgi:hypothetical protein